MEEKYFLRDVLGGYMGKLGEKNDRVMLVNADLMGTCRNREFVEKYPERSFNVGIAEQNLVSFAAGLSAEGFIPYAFSMAPFISMRACEQCRTDVAYGNRNVRLVATYSGVSGGISGATHWAVEDVAIMSSMANMAVMEPCDPEQARQMLDYSLNHVGPIYFRSSVESVPSIYGNDYLFEFGKASIPFEGDDGAFIVSGITVKYAIAAAMEIENIYGKKIRVVDMHTIKPLDKEAVIEAAKTGAVVVAQDHSVVGGLGQLVASTLIEKGVCPKFVSIGIPDAFFAMAHAPYLYHQFGFDTEGLVKSMMNLLEG